MTETFRSLKLLLLPNPNGYELSFTKGLSTEEGFVSAIHVVSELLKKLPCLVSLLFNLILDPTDKSVSDLLNKLPCLISLLLNLILDSLDEIIPRPIHCQDFIRKSCHIICKFTHKLLLSRRTAVRLYKNEISRYIKLGWVLKDKNPTTILYPPLNPLPRGDFSNSPLERG